MSTIVTIIFIILGGLVFGFAIARLFILVSDSIVGRKTRKRILSEGEKAFYYKNNHYALKKEIENELKNYTPWYKKLFSRKVKGGNVSDYGTSESIKREPISTTGEGNKGGEARITTPKYTKPKFEYRTKQSS